MEEKQITSASVHFRKAFNLQITLHTCNPSPNKEHRPSSHWHSIPTHTPATRLGHTADCNLPIHKPAIRLDTTFKLCEVHRHMHWATSPYTSTSTWSHHVLFNQSHTEGWEHSFCLIHTFNRQKRVYACSHLPFCQSASIMGCCNKRCLWTHKMCLQPGPHMFKHLYDYGVTCMSVLHIQSDFDQHT